MGSSRRALVDKNEYLDHGATMTFQWQWWFARPPPPSSSRSIHRSSSIIARNVSRKKNQNQQKNCAITTTTTTTTQIGCVHTQTELKPRASSCQDFFFRLLARQGIARLLHFSLCQSFLPFFSNKCQITIWILGGEHERRSNTTREGKI
jgi:hypothetical protein